MRYNDYYELTEKHGWRVTDLDWSGLVEDNERGLISDGDRAALQGTAVIEYGVPHYAEVWSMVDGLHDDWELWQFTTLWTGEEHRHSYALNKACDVLGVSGGIADDLATVTSFAFAEAQKQSCPSDCFRTVPGMVTYATIQELATNKFYAEAARRTQSPALRRLFSEIGSDEMRHHVFYRDALRSAYERSDRPAWYVDQVFDAVQAFQMPHKLYDLQVDMFDNGNWGVVEGIRAPLAKCFSFDDGLLRRLFATMGPPAPPAGGHSSQTTALAEKFR